MDAGEASTGLREALDETCPYRIHSREEDNRDPSGHPLRYRGDRCAYRDDDLRVGALEIPRRSLGRLQVSPGVAKVEDDLLTVLEAQLTAALPQALDQRLPRAA